MAGKTVRASELGLYLYCRRAWWYQRRGVDSANQAEMLSGSDLHRRHGRGVLAAGVLRLAGAGAALLALVALTAYCTQAVF